jgi:hypothetical protein
MSTPHLLSLRSIGKCKFEILKFTTFNLQYDLSRINTRLAEPVLKKKGGGRLSRPLIIIIILFSRQSIFPEFFGIISFECVDCIIICC